jgi:mannose-binding lectin 1
MKRIQIVLVLLFVLLQVNLLSGFAPKDVLKRFEYKLSFKGPHLVFKDGTVPFWEHSGSTIASNDQIRITPSLHSQKGRIWSKTNMSSDDWEIEVAVRINGRGRIGADGMAIWYTDKMGHQGSVFGSNDYWNGLGVFLDSFDNDNQQNNPYILIMTNDGSKSYDHHRDGIDQQIGGCLRDFRNKPFAVHLKIEYYKKALTVYYHNGLNNDYQNYEICDRIENVILPKFGHFGVSAETGGLADDHDVLSFLTHSLSEKQKENVC